MRRTLQAAVVACMVVLTGCAAAATGSGHDRSVITREEIARANQLNALELVRTERPHWIRIRGSTSFRDEPEIAVYLDGVRAGSVDALANFATINIEEVRYYDARQAQYRFGVGNVHGAIEVISRKD